MKSHEDLVKAFEAVKVAALAVRNTEDGGTCNFDSAVIWPGRSRVAIERAAAEAGLPLSHSDWRGKSCLFVRLTEGQGACRTAMAEAAYKTLQAHGIDSSIYYQMD